MTLDVFKHMHPHDVATCMFIEAPFGAYTSMVVHLFLCSIEFFSREPTLGVSGNSDGCRWLSDPTSRVQIGEQQSQVETLRDCGVSKSHNLNRRDTLKPLMFFPNSFSYGSLPI